MRHLVKLALRWAIVGHRHPLLTYAWRRALRTTRRNTAPAEASPSEVAAALATWWWAESWTGGGGEALLPTELGRAAKVALLRQVEAAWRHRALGGSLTLRIAQPSDLLARSPPSVRRGNCRRRASGACCGITHLTADGG